MIQTVTSWSSVSNILRLYAGGCPHTPHLPAHPHPPIHHPPPSAMLPDTCARAVCPHATACVHMACYSHPQPDKCCAPACQGVGWRSAVGFVRLSSRPASRSAAACPCMNRQPSGRVGDGWAPLMIVRVAAHAHAKSSTLHLLLHLQYPAPTVPCTYSPLHLMQDSPLSTQHTHSHTQSHTVSNTHAHTHSLSLSLSHTHTHTVAHSHTVTRTHAHTCTHARMHTHTHSHTTTTTTTTTNLSFACMPVV